VGFEVAQALHAPLDVFLVRKLGYPGHEELAMGAIASGGVQVLNDEVVRRLRVAPDVIESVAAQELRELRRRERIFRAKRPPPDAASIGQRAELTIAGVAEARHDVTQLVEMTVQGGEVNIDIRMRLVQDADTLWRRDDGEVPDAADAPSLEQGDRRCRRAAGR